MANPVLECRDVSAGHSRDGETRVVFAGASFSVPAGARLVVLGGSSAGKSSLLRLLNRLDEPLSGLVLFHGEPVTACDPLILRRKVALVQQTPVMFEGTVADNLRTRPRRDPAPRDEHLASLLTDVGLSPDFMNRGAAALSVGEQQRVALARALVSEPEVILLDEPTSALDPRMLAKLAELLVGLSERRGLAIVATTHQEELLERLGGTVLLIERGQVRTDVPASDVGAFFGAA
jgi:ABC-type methionine transport system ATPase subunit